MTAAASNDNPSSWALYVSQSRFAFFMVRIEEDIYTWIRIILRMVRPDLGKEKKRK